jgi:cell division protein FtsL
MTLDMGVIIAILIALVTSCIVIIYSITENMQMQREVYRLRNELRKQRTQ